MAQGTSFEGFGFGLHQRDVSGRDLLLAARRGDAAAFQELVHPYDAVVMRAALALTGSEETAQDIYCQVFRDGFESLHTLEPNGSVFVWLHRILVKRCTEYCRSDKHAVPDSPETDPSLTLAKLLRALPPTERIVLLLKHAQGLKIRTLAEIFNCPPEYIVDIFEKGTQRLRAQLRPIVRQID